jgi:hypothetical protein
MEHDDEVCRLRELVAAQGATIAAMEKAVPLALAAKEAEKQASIAIERANAAVAGRASDRIAFYIQLAVSIALGVLVFFHDK